MSSKYKTSPWMSTLGNPIWSNIKRHGTLSFKGIPSLPCDKCLKFHPHWPHGRQWLYLFLFLFSSFPFMYQLGMLVIKVSNVWRTIITFFWNILAIWSIPSCTISCENQNPNSKLALTNFMYELQYKNTKF
jgi:hypothetical protein